MWDLTPSCIYLPLAVHIASAASPVPTKVKALGTFLHVALLPWGSVGGGSKGSSVATGASSRTVSGIPKIMVSVFQLVSM